jgi:hypothetical protein
VSDRGDFFVEVDAPADCALRVRSEWNGRIGEGPAVTLHTRLGEDAFVMLRYPEEADFRAPTPRERAARAEIDRQLEDMREILRTSGTDEGDVPSAP